MPFLGILHTFSSIDCGPRLSFKLLMATLESPASCCVDCEDWWCWLCWLPHVAVCQNPIPLVNIKIAGKWMFIPLKMVCIGIDPYPCSVYNPKSPLLSPNRWRTHRFFASRIPWMVCISMGAQGQALSVFASRNIFGWVGMYKKWKS